MKNFETNAAVRTPVVSAGMIRAHLISPSARDVTTLKCDRLVAVPTYTLAV
jgi:hypothetical protein